MTNSLGLSGVFGDVVIVSVLVVTVGSPRVSQVARPLIAALAFVSAWLLTAVLDALRAPAWTMFTGCAVIVLMVGMIVVTVHCWTLGGEGEEGLAGQQGDQGGGGPRRRRPDTPQHGGGGSHPSWWPEFERQFAAYVAEREKETAHQQAARAESFTLPG